MLTGFYGSALSLFPAVTSQIDFFNPVHPGVPVPSFPFSFASSFKQDTAGLYLQDQVELPYKIFVLAGARYQYIRQASASGTTLYDLTPSSGSPATAQAVTPRFGLLWRPQKWVSLYGNYTEGFGPNQGLVFPGKLAPPSSARSWEAGVKFEFFDGKLRATADYYDLTKTNVPTADPLNPNFVVLAGAARSKGPELDIQGEILPGWNVIVAYTNQDVRVTEASAGSFPAAGQRFPLVARNIASFWSTYEFQDAMFKGLKVGAGYHYIGSRPLQDLSGANPPTPYPLLPSYGTVDLMGAYGFDVAGTKMTAQLNITNLLDRTYYTAATVFLPFQLGLQGFSFRSYGAPFAAMGSLRVEF
jgi:iron complex outermembrane receptor protein